MPIWYANAHELQALPSRDVGHIPSIMVRLQSSPPTIAKPLGPTPTHGFTLIEIAVALAITAILATVAYPSYQQHVLRSKTSEATNALVEGRHQMEQYFLNNRTYANGPCATSQTVAGGTFTVVCPNSGAGLPDADSYIIVATGSGTAAGLKLTIDERGSQKTTAVPTGWAAVPAGGHRCWLLNKGTTC